MKTLFDDATLAQISNGATAQNKTTKKSYREQFIDAFTILARSYGKHRIFEDFAQMSSLSLSQTAKQTVGLPKDEKDEDDYMSIVKRYKPDEVQKLAYLLTLTINGLEYEKGDWLGEIYGHLQIGNTALGQFFTPFHICKMMAEMAGTPEEIQEQIDNDGFIMLSEPCCGGGAMAIAYADVLKEHGFNPAVSMFAVARDLSSVAAAMCHVQLSLYGIPAVVQHADSLTDSVLWSRFTPVYYWYGWSRKLAARKKAQESKSTEQESNEINPLIETSDELKACGIDDCAEHVI